MKKLLSVLAIFLGFGLITFIVGSTETLQIQKSDLNVNKTQIEINKMTIEYWEPILITSWGKLIKNE